MRLLPLIACLIASCCSVPRSYTEATNSVWQLWNTFTGGRASAVPIAIYENEVWVLTARHVPNAVAPLGWFAKNRDGDKLEEGRVVSLHPVYDAAIMAFPIPDGLDPPITKLNYEPLKFGDRTYSSGWGGGHFLWVTVGIVSGPNRVTVQIAPGDSGGGLFDEEGNLIAILVARGSNVDAHMAFVVPLSNIELWLKKNLEEPTF